MPKNRRYPPAYYRYQQKTPAVTIRVTKKLKSNLDAMKGHRSYAEVIAEILNNTFDLDKEIEKLPVTEALVKYKNGFNEAFERFVQVGICKKCSIEDYLLEDGKCIDCHEGGSLDPDFSKFNDKEDAEDINEDTFKKAKTELLDPEKAIYENGLIRGRSEGVRDTTAKIERQYRITFPCSYCGRPIEITPGGPLHQDILKYLKREEWGHSECSR